MERSGGGLPGRALARRADVGLAAAIVLLVGMMVVPVPPRLLDLLLVANLALALVSLLVAVQAKDPLEVAVFPTVLLVATVFRLALTVSSTRLILLHGYAGEVIHQFGQFVVGGDAVVGFVVFVILVIIQFVVITRGAERVAEVAARFTLDALPGKQMSIDADLSAGLIDEAEARRRRAEVAREADFYGAMDGASKFVKGDAVASILILVVNLLGGFAIGMLQRGLSFADALHTYSLLTVGDGLVTQIPALLLSTAAGIIVTRTASEASLGQDVARQLFGNPRVLALGAAVLAVLAILPGLPELPLLALGGLLGGLAYVTRRGPAPAAPPPAPAPPRPEAEDLAPLLQVDDLEVELGYGLISLAQPEASGRLLERVAALRRQIAGELGMVVPLVRIRDNVQLPPHDYVLRIRGVEVGRGTVFPDRYLAMDPGTAAERLEGLPAREPAFGLPAVWIGSDQRDRAEVLGYTVVDAATVISTHLSRVVRRHAWQLFSRQDARRLLDRVREQAPALVDELIPEPLKLGDVHRVLRNLLREGVPIRDLTTILETLADRATRSRDPEVLTEYVRQALAPALRDLLPFQGDVLRAVAFGPATTELLERALRRGDDGTTYLALAPEQAERIVARIRAAVERAAGAGREVVLLAPPLVRLHLRRLLEPVLPDLPVCSYAELPPHGRVEAEEVIELAD